MTTPNTAEDRAPCPAWCTAEHKPSERYPSHSRTIATIGSMKVMITCYRFTDRDDTHVHVLDSRAWQEYPSSLPADRQSARMEPGDAFAMAEILRRRTEVPAPRGGKVAKSAAPYAAALAELQQLGEAIAEGVRILDAAAVQSPAAGGEQ